MTSSTVTEPHENHRNSCYLCHWWVAKQPIICNFGVHHCRSIMPFWPTMSLKLLRWWHGSGSPPLVISHESLRHSTFIHTPELSNKAIYPDIWTWWIRIRIAHPSHCLNTFGTTSLQTSNYQAIEPLLVPKQITFAWVVRFTPLHKAANQHLLFVRLGVWGLFQRTMETQEFLHSTHWKKTMNKTSSQTHTRPSPDHNKPRFRPPNWKKHQVLPLAFSFWVSASVASRNSEASVPCDASWRCSNTGAAQNGTEVEIEGMF